MSMVDPEDRGRPLAMHHVSRRSYFDPRVISSLTGDYDFSDAATLFTDTARTTLVAADSDAIAGVTDKSGGGRHLTRGGLAATAPVFKLGGQNNLSFARFDGTRWLLSGATFGADTQQTIVCVAKNGGGSVLMAPWSRTDNNNTRLTATWNNGSNAIGAIIGTGSGSYSEVWAAATVGWVVVTLIVNNSGAISKTYGDGVLRSSATGTPGITLSTLLAIGSRQTGSLTSGFNSDIGRVLTFSTALSDTDRQYVERGVKNQWATA